MLTLVKATKPGESGSSDVSLGRFVMPRMPFSLVTADVQPAEPPC